MPFATGSTVTTTGGGVGHRCRLHVVGHGQVSDVSVHRVLRYLQIELQVLVHHRRQTLRQLHAVDIFVVRERRDDRDVAHVRVVAHRGHRRRQMRGLIDRERHHVAESGRDVHELHAALAARVGQPGGRIERRAHDGDRVMEQLHSTVACGSVAGPRQRAVRCRVVGDDAVESLRHALSRGAGELELRFAELLHASPAVGQVDRTRVFRDLPDRQLVVGQPVLPGVRCRAATGDLKRRQRLDARGAPECGGGIVDDFPLRRRRCAAHSENGDEDERGCSGHHAGL